MRPKGKLENKTGLIQEERNLDVRFSGYAYGERAAALRSGQVGNDGLPDKDEITETARIVREVSKSEDQVKNGLSRSQEDKGLHNPSKIPVVMAKGIHLFPYRTQKLSLSAPMVLGWRRPGRVGHCRIP